MPRTASDSGAGPRGGETGFTKVELSIGLALVIPLLFGVLSLTHSFAKADEQVRASRSAKGQLQQTFDRIGRLLTAASWGSLRVLAKGDGTGGQWTYPRGRVVTNAIRFQSVVDDTPVEGAGESLTLRFVLEADEKLDGEDNDRDGLIDEGHVQFELGPDSARAVELAQKVEACSFLVADGVVTIEMKVAVREPTGEIERAVHRRSVWLRNP